MSKPRILHISTAHSPHDPRLVYRVMPSLAPYYELIALLPNVPKSGLPGIRCISLPFFRRVITRFLVSHPRVLWHALRLRPTLLHLYDPELLPVARLIQLLLGIPVIYEVHENLHKKADLKALNQGRLVVWFFRQFDAMAQRRFWLIFTEHGYLSTYTRLRYPSVVVYNFPSLSFLEPYRRPYQPDPAQPRLFYIGWLSLERAFDTLVAGLAQWSQTQPDFRVHLFGERTFSDTTMQQLPGFRQIASKLIFHGYTSQREALPYAEHALAGLALLKPVGDYPESYTTKMFEYMALGLPVITADFPLYRDVVERHGCGFCIAPDSPAQLADALTYLTHHPAEARAMGERGRQAVARYYNWETEARKLRSFYRQVLGNSPDS
ncbi:glycosyltransferase family 4 protein [Spirosoma luteolum]